MSRLATRWTLFVAVAEYDNPYLDRYCLEFAHKVAEARGVVPRFVRLSRHNHYTITAHINTEEEFLGREMLDFVQRGS